MKKVMLYLVLAATALFVAIPAFAAEAQRKNDAILKIGVIDMQKIMRESKAAGLARDSFAKEVGEKRKTLAAKEKEVRLLDEELKKTASQLSPEARKGKTAELAKEGKELKRLRDDLTEELKKRNADLTQKLIAEVMRLVRDLSRNEHYSLVLEKGAVVLADDAIDITDKIIKSYDAGK